MESYELSRGRAGLTGGFWGERQELMRRVTLGAIRDRFRETGRFDALRLQWREGQPNKPHIFWDSDVAKWIEGAAYLLMDRRDAAVEAEIDGVEALIRENRTDDGYFNSYYLTLDRGARFTRYHDHELYCLGHWIEAAVAYDQATGKRGLLELMIDYADLVDRVFREEGSAAFHCPGHEEIELALYKLYRHTGEARFLRLMRHFIDERGAHESDRAFDPKGGGRYTQTHLPVREQLTAEGHSVRACYLYCAMADLAYEDGDEGLAIACRALFHNIAARRMYVSGGIGSTRVGEAFTVDFDLPNLSAYAETCAALAFALFLRRLSRLEPDGRYADAAELAIYNGTLAGISLSGDAFFYENPLESQPELNRHFRYEGYPPTRRQTLFSCSCCPPNLLRFIGSIQEFAYTESEDTLYAHHYMDCDARTRFGPVVQRTDYPFGGTATLTMPAGGYALAVRLPGWAREWRLYVNGRAFAPEVRGGYAYVRRVWNAGDEVLLQLPMEVRLVRAHPAVREDCGRVAVMRGPILFCAEQEDNGRWLADVAVRRGAAFEYGRDEALGVPTLATVGTRRSKRAEAALYSDVPVRRIDAPVTLIPYFAWCNRGEGEMRVWLMEEI